VRRAASGPQAVATPTMPEQPMARAEDPVVGNCPLPTGPAFAAAAYILWGVFPLYVKQVAMVPALQVVAQRSFWSLVFVFALLALLGRLH
jgi:hypothetical protein